MILNGSNMKLKQMNGPIYRGCGSLISSQPVNQTNSHFYLSFCLWLVDVLCVITFMIKRFSKDQKKELQGR